jgi:hypothetical protein
VKFIFSRFDDGFFSENRREENEKVSILDNPLLLEYLRDLSEMGSLFNEDDFGGCCFGEGNKKKP